MSVERRVAWDMYFSGICAFQYHPGNDAKSRMPLQLIGEIADAMLRERDLRFYLESTRGEREAVSSVDRSSRADRQPPGCAACQDE